MVRKKETRPLAAIGHVSMRVGDVTAATDYFVDMGLRHITQSETMGILELRGGTHLVLRAGDDDIAAGTKAPFDLMVDDVAATRADYVDKGLDASEVETGRVHRWFELTTPDGYVITVTSSHVSGQPV
jgi:catechol 2,3-dioxygenase-like lactoylglutathione lyase family enzyme